MEHSKTSFMFLIRIPKSIWDVFQNIITVRLSDNFVQLYLVQLSTTLIKSIISVTPDNMPPYEQSNVNHDYVIPSKAI